MPQNFLQNLLPELILDRPLRQYPNLWSNIWPNLAEDEQFPLNARIYEENNHLHIELPVPGLNSSDIEVSLTKGVLLVKGESKEEEKDKKRKFHRYFKRNYSYSLILPVQIDEKQEPQATYTDGILNIALQLPKQEETKKIAVKAAPKKNP